ncbi:PIG-L family deacetylase [Nocardioides aestuarii]|uniref:PIG-L family deacetylase n=1 Tax=Nocardioides aestuarii TaxID=252231 RepID=A0ABW4TPF6_9ACTN
MTSTHAPAAPPRSLVGLWAHPDDESYLSAGLMDRVLRAGGRVTVVTLSDGEAGFPDDDPRSVEQRRCLRRTELRSAMAAIGVTDVRFVGLPDVGLADIGTDVLRAAFREVLAELRPEVTVTFGPDGITGHDDHVVTSYAATEAWQELALPGGQLWYAAKTHGWLDEWRDLHDRLGVWMTEEPTGVADEDVALALDLAPGELARKRAALAAHASQSGPVAAAMGEATYRRWIGQEAFRLPMPTGARS